MKYIQHLGHSLEGFCWFTGQMDLSGCLLKTRPNPRKQQSMGSGDGNRDVSFQLSGPKCLVKYAMP